MPTYEYRCPAGHDFDHFSRRIGEASPTMPCPTCGAVAERRISAGGGLLFKGSGFYITDYGKDGKKDQRAKPAAAKESAADAAAPKADAKSESRSSDAKPAAGSAASAGNNASKA